MIFTEYVLPIIVISILILLNGLFVAAEFAIVAARKTRIAHLSNEGNVAAGRILNTLSNPELQNRYITTAQVGITLVSLGLGMYGEHAIADWLLPVFGFLGEASDALAHTLATVLSIGFLTYLHVVIGEMIPKSIALQAAESTSMRLDLPMSAFERIFTPFIFVLNHLGNWFVRILRLPAPDEDGRLFTSEELEFIVEESMDVGLLEPSEQLFIENIIDLQDRSVRYVMTPRTQVVGLSMDKSEEEIFRIICETRKSRYPIYKETIDQIVGILHIKDLARHRTGSPKGSLNLNEIKRPTLFVPESLDAEQMLAQFRNSRVQMAVVIDEFGGTGGVITLEDIIEEVVGEIEDEFDQETLLVEKVSEGLLRARGDFLLDELEQLYDIDLSHEEAVTVGGLFMSILGRIPQKGDVIEHKGFQLEVMVIERLAVQLVLIRYPPPPEEKQTED